MSAKKIAIEKRTTPQRRILVVDDNPDTRQLSVDLLMAFGYSVETARDGDAGWEAIQTTEYDLVITDNQMPRMTGLNMIEKVRSASMALPILMATGHLPTFEFARRPWLMPDGALQRPFSNADLINAVVTILAGGRKKPLLPIPAHVRARQQLQEPLALIAQSEPLKREDSL